MKVTLVTPNEKKFLTNAGDRMPLSALYLSSALTANGHKNNIIDMNHTPWLQAIDQIKQDKPDAVGLSVLSSASFPQMKRFAHGVRPYTGKVIAGGFHASALPESLNNVARTTVTGYGEDGLIKALESDDDIIEAPFDANKYPIPDRTKLNKDNYDMSLLGLKIAPMTTARGCPYSCGFCGNMHKKVDFRNPKNIDAEAQQIKDMGYEAVYFYNESHTLNRDHAIRTGEIMKKHGLRYRLETRSNLIDDDMAKMLSDTGCMLVALGIESGDNKVLKAINKGTTREQDYEAVMHLAKHGIPSKGYFIMGLPEQDLASGLRSIEFAKQLKKHGMIFADFYSLTPFPGSPIHDNPEKYGVHIEHKNYKKYLQATKTSANPVVSTDWLSKEGIKSLCDRARLEWKDA